MATRADAAGGADPRAAADLDAQGRPPAHNAALAAVADIVGKVSTLAWTVVAARALTQDEFGTFSLALSLALLVWVIYIGTGIKHQGLGYFGHLLWPPGVPTALKPLVGAIEFISTIIVTPFSLTVRLMANMLAGHILLVTFALLTEALLFAETKQAFLVPMSILPFGMLIFLTGFEVLVAFLQAYIFTILAAVYINNSTVGHGDEH